MENISENAHQRHFTTPEVAYIYGISKRLAAKVIDNNLASAYRLENHNRDRRVPGEELLATLQDESQVKRYREFIPGILVVDKSAQLANELREHLHEAYFNVLHAPDEYYVAGQPEKWSPEAAVIDESVESFVELGKWMRKKWKEELIILGCESPESNRKLSKVGLFNEVFLKPFDSELLAQRLKTLMSKE